MVLMKQSLRSLVPSKFKCKPPSLIAKSSLMGFPCLKNDLKECKNWIFLVTLNCFRSLFTNFTLSPRVAWSSGLGSMLEIMIFAFDNLFMMVIKLLKALMI